jgi:UDP-N-acetyl-D-mannosaminuronate dehydrogenase
MFPGIGVGGYCLTKDPLLASWARTNLLGGKGRLTQSETAVSINDQMPRYAFEFLKTRYSEPFDSAKVLLLGVSYRGDVGDTRYSPVEYFCRCLLNAGAIVASHDPYVCIWPELNMKPCRILSEALRDQPDVVVISTGHHLYQEEETINVLFECKSMLIYDTIGLLSKEQINKLQQKHKVIVLGRGDL